MPAAGTSHCGSYKSPGPNEHTVINSSLKRDGEFVFFPPSSRVYPALSQSVYTSHQSPPSGGLSSNQSDAVRHTHTYKELCVCVEEVEVIDRLLLFPFVGEFDYCGIICGFSY